VEQGNLYFCCQHYSATTLLGKSVKCIEWIYMGGRVSVVRQTLSKITLSFLIRCPRDAWC